MSEDRFVMSLEARRTMMRLPEAQGDGSGHGADDDDDCN